MVGSCANLLRLGGSFPTARASMSALGIASAWRLGRTTSAVTLGGTTSSICSAAALGRPLFFQARAIQALSFSFESAQNCTLDSGREY